MEENEKICLSQQRFINFEIIFLQILKIKNTILLQLPFYAVRASDVENFFKMSLELDLEYVWIWITLKCT